MDENQNERSDPGISVYVRISSQVEKQRQDGDIMEFRFNV